MARPGITYEEVAAAAESLTANGQHAGIIAVRNHLGTGSPNTINRHLKKWRESRPAQVVSTVEMPQSFVKAFNDEINRAVSLARAESQQALAATQAEVDELSSLNESLEESNENLLTEIEKLTAERNELRILLEQQEQTAIKYQAEIKREQEATEFARIETAKSHVELEQLRSLVKDLNEQLKVSTAALEQAKTEAVTANQQAAVAVAKADSERDKTADLTQRLANAEKRAEEALKEAKQASDQAMSKHIAEQRAQVQAESLQKQLETALKDAESHKELANKAREEAQRALNDAATSRGKLEAALSQLHELQKAQKEKDKEQP